MSEPNPEFKAYGSSRMQWLEDWRNEFDSATDAHDATTHRRSIDHTGWYLDNTQYETTCGVVLRTAKPCAACGGSGATGVALDDTCEACDGEGRTFTYAAAIKDPWNTHAALVDREDTYTDIDECARHADRLAEQYAEKAREDDAKQLAESEVEAAIAEIQETRRAHTRLVGAVIKYRDGSMDNAGCTRERADLRKRVRKLAKRIKALRENCWAAVES